MDLVLEGEFGRVAIEIKHTSTVAARDLQALREFVKEHRMRLGLVVTNDRTARVLDERLLGLPFHWL